MGRVCELKSNSHDSPRIYHRRPWYDFSFLQNSIIRSDAALCQITLALVYSFNYSISLIVFVQLCDAVSSGRIMMFRWRMLAAAESDSNRERDTRRQRAAQQRQVGGISSRVRLIRYRITIVKRSTDSCKRAIRLSTSAKSRRTGAGDIFQHCSVLYWLAR